MLNEHQKKFINTDPISPILIDSKLSKFRNSNSPPKSAKLHTPISITFKNSQFNMWNDFDSFRHFDIELLKSFKISIDLT